MCEMHRSSAVGGWCGAMFTRDLTSETIARRYARTLCLKRSGEPSFLKLDFLPCHAVPCGGGLGRGNF
jgi:hypothetical protein